MKLRAFSIISVTLGLIFLAYKAGQAGQTHKNNTSALPPVPTATVAIDRLKLEYPKQVKDEVSPQKALPKYIFIGRGKFFYMDSITRFVGVLENVNLNSEQIEQMQDVYNVVVEARLNYERSKARLAQVGSSTVVEIPSYEAFGTQLRAAMLSTFEAILGKDTAAAVNDQMGIRIDAENALWGKFPQAIEGEFDRTNNAYQITHVINPTPSNPDAFQQEFSSTLAPDGLNIYSAYFPLPSQSK